MKITHKLRDYQPSDNSFRENHRQRLAYEKQLMKAWFNDEDEHVRKAGIDETLAAAGMQGIVASLDRAFVLQNKMPARATGAVGAAAGGTLGGFGAVKLGAALHFGKAAIVGAAAGTGVLAGVAVGSVALYGAYKTIGWWCGSPRYAVGDAAERLDKLFSNIDQWTSGQVYCVLSYLIANQGALSRDAKLDAIGQEIANALIDKERESVRIKAMLAEIASAKECAGVSGSQTTLGKKARKND